MPDTPFAPIHGRTDSSNRLPIPKEFASRVSWLRGTDQISGWFWLVSAGRYRVLPDDQVKSDTLIAAVWSLITDGAGHEISPPSEAEDDVTTALMARLTPTTISPPGPVWRILIPKGVREFTPRDYDTERYSMLIQGGHWEIWQTDALLRAAVSPLKSRV